jgi:hypothetical protein
MALASGIAVFLTGAALAGAGPPSSAQEPFRSDIVLLTIDVQVKSSAPALRAFGPEDFEVTIAGRKRPVVSAVRLHLDEGSLLRNPPRPGQGSSTDCVFGFHRRTDGPVTHYLLAIRPEDTVRAAREMKVKTVDPAFATEWVVWRLPIR